MAQLAAKRDEFWDTRVQGRAEMWQALRVACEAGDEGTSAAILESAGLTPFDIENPDTCFVYDQKGWKYEVPLYCLYTPGNLLRDPPPASAAAVKPGQPVQHPLHVQVAPNAARHAPAEEEAKMPEMDAAAAGAGKVIKFKIRFSNGLPDLSIEQRNSCNIGNLKALIAAKYPELAPDRVRIYYLGKYMVSNSWNLGEIGMKKEMVLQCFVPMKKT